MTKTERLFHIINYLRVHKTSTIDELAKECKVSSRTTYRDVTDLETLRAAVYENNIIRLSKLESAPHWHSTPEEVDMMQFALRANPLASKSYFQGKLMAIGVKLQKEMDRKGKSYPADGFFLTMKETAGLAKRASATREEENLWQFWRHCQNKRAVKITMKKSGRGAAKQIVARCKHMEWANGKWWFDVVTEIEREPMRIDSTRVAVVQPQRRYRK